MTLRRVVPALAVAAWVLLSACSASETSLDYRQVPAEALATPYPGLEFTDIREIVETANAIWVLDIAPPFVTRIERGTGSVLRVGERGEGPAEFSRPVALQVNPGDGSVHIWDLGSRRHTVFDAALTLVHSEPIRGAAWAVSRDIREVSYADPYRVRATVDGVLVSDFPSILNVTTDLPRGTLVRADPTLLTERELFRFAEHTDPSNGHPREFVAVPLWDACGSDLVVWQPRSHQLAWLDRHGRVITSVSAPGRPSPIDARDIAAYLEEMARLELGADYTKAGIDFMALARDTRPVFSDRLPFATEVVCADRGVAWLRVFDNRTDPFGRGRRWLRVSHTGAIEAIEFPEVFRPVAATARGVLGSYEFPEGVRWLAEWTD